LPFINALPEWNKQGVEPPQSLKDGGWQAQQKPPADYFNWFQHTTYKALEEIRVYLDNLEVTPSWDDIEGKPTAFPPTSHTHTKDEVGLSNVDNVQQASKTEFMSHLAEEIHQNEVHGMRINMETGNLEYVEGTEWKPLTSGSEKLSTHRLSPDENGYFTVIEFKREDGTLAEKRTLSNVDSDGNYHTQTIEYYDNSGALIPTNPEVYAITYDDNGNVISEVLQ
jgi:hypothetical protein